jgi:hypothetical protein
LELILGAELRISAPTEMAKHCLREARSGFASATARRIGRIAKRPVRPRKAKKNGEQNAGGLFEK